MTPELNLDGRTEEEVTGKPDDRSEPERKRRTGAKPGRPSNREKELRSGLSGVRDRFLDRLDERGDEELADALRKDGQAIIDGAVKLARNVPAVAAPLLLAVRLIEPVLAFGHLARVLIARVAVRRQARAEQQQAEEMMGNPDQEFVAGIPVQPNVPNHVGDPRAAA